MLFRLRNGKPWPVLLHFGQVGGKPADLRIPHGKDIAEHRVEQATVPSPGSYRPFGDYDIVFLHHPGNGDGRAADECIVLDLLVERVLSGQMKSARHVPLDVVGQTGQDLLVVGSVEAVNVFLYHHLVLGHAASPVATPTRCTPAPEPRYRAS